MDKSSTLRDYLSIVRRRRWLLVGTIGVCLVVALGSSFTTTPLYRATAQLTYEKQPDIATALSGTANYSSGLDVKREIETYANLIVTAEMRQRAHQVDSGIDLSPEKVTVSADYVVDTNVMSLSAVSAYPRLSTAAANAYANALVGSLNADMLQQYTDAEQIIKEKISQFTPEQQAAGDPAYLALLARLEDVRILKSAAKGSLTIASQAQVPTQPFTPNHARDAVLGLLIGVVAGIGLVALAEQLDVRVHSVEDIVQMTGLPVIGRLPRVGKEAAGRDDLQVVSEPQGPLSEAFRMVRGNLEFVDVDETLKTILFTSSSQSEGKTSTVCNLAVTLARTGKNVIVVDADLRRPRVHALFKLRNRIGVSTVVTGRSTLEESMQTIPGAPQQSGQVGSLRVLPSGPTPPNPGELVASRSLAAVIAELADRADIVLVDTAPALVVGDAGALAGSVQGLILIARLGIVTKSMLREVNEFLASLPTRKLGVVVTAVPTEASAYRYRYYREKAGADADSDAQLLETPISPAESV